MKRHYKPGSVLQRVTVIWVSKAGPHLKRAICALFCEIPFVLLLPLLLVLLLLTTLRPFNTLHLPRFLYTAPAMSVSLKIISHSPSLDMYGEPDRSYALVYFHSQRRLTSPIDQHTPSPDRSPSHFFHHPLSLNVVERPRIFSNLST